MLNKICDIGKGGFRGGAPGARPSLKLKKKMIFLRKIVIFHTKYPKNIKCAPPPNLKSWILPRLVLKKNIRTSMNTHIKKRREYHSRVSIYIYS